MATSRLVKHVPFYYGWVVVGAVSLIMFSSASLANTTISVFVSPLTDQFGWSRSAISGAVSLSTVCAALLGPFMGRIADTKHGSRMLLSGGGFLMGVALLGLGSMQNLLMFYCFLALGRAMMMSLENLIATVAIANWFISRRATATAIVLMSSRIGLGVWPLVAAGLFIWSGWRGAFWAMGIIAILVSIAPLVFLISRRPEEVGLSPDGDKSASSTIQAGGDPGVNAEPTWSAREALGTRAFWMIMIATGLAMAFGGGVGLHRIPYFVERGLSDSLIGPIVFGFAAGMAIGGFGVAKLSKSLAERNVMGLLLLFGAGLLGILLVTPPNGFAVVVAILEGIVLGGVFALTPVMYANYYGRQSVGTIRGLAHPAIVGGSAFGSIFGGVMYDLLGKEYTWAFLGFAIMMVMAAVCAFLATPPNRSEQRT